MNSLHNAKKRRRRYLVTKTVGYALYNVGGAARVLAVLLAVFGTVLSVLFIFWLSGSNTNEKQGFLFVVPTTIALWIVVGTSTKCMKVGAKLSSVAYTPPASMPPEVVTRSANRVRATVSSVRESVLPALDRVTQERARWYHFLVAFVFPFLGLPWGIAHLARRRPGPGLLMTVVSGILCVPIVIWSWLTDGLAAANSDWTIIGYVITALPIALIASLPTQGTSWIERVGEAFASIMKELPLLGLALYLAALLVPTSIFGYISNLPDKASAIAGILQRNNQPAIDSLVDSAVHHLQVDGTWIDDFHSREIYKTLLSCEPARVVDTLKRRVPNRSYRPQIVLLAVKLGIDGTEAALNEVLLAKGDIAMAEDYLNSGSPELSSDAQLWASLHGYTVGRGGNGSNRANWGKF